MRVRVAVNAAVFAFIWSLLSFFYLLGNLRYVTLQLTVIAALLGVIVGAVLGFAAAKRQLKFLTKNGETRVHLSTTLFFIGSLLIFLSLLYFFVVDAQIVKVTTAIAFVHPFLPAYSASEAILFFRWERQHRKLILAGSRSNRLYVSPQVD